jgi:hypothetical protein
MEASEQPSLVLTFAFGRYMVLIWADTFILPEKDIFEWCSGYIYTGSSGFESRLGTDYPDRVYSWLSSVLPLRYWVNALKYITPNSMYNLPS